MATIEFPAYVDYVYEIVKRDCADTESILESYIKSIVGTYGFNELIKHKLLIPDVTLQGEQLYMLNFKE